MLKQFILDCEKKDDIFVEEKTFGLSVASQSTIIKYIFNFIKREYSLSVEPTIVEEVCKSAVELFESLKQKDSTIGGIVSRKIPY